VHGVPAPDERPLPRAFAWLWGAFAVSTLGTWFAFDALAIIAVRVLHAGPAAVAALAAAGPAVGALLAVPLGPWIEFRHKRSVMIAMDLARGAALLSIPFAYALGALTVAQLALVSVAVGAADIAFKAASGARVKAIVPRDRLLRANGRLESTQWTATLIGPPLGGAAIALLGSVTTVIADAISFGLSALALLRGGAGAEARTVRQPTAGGLRRGELLEGWRFILTSPALRLLCVNNVLVAALIMATAPLMAVLMLGHLGFVPWEYGLAFGAPCIGGLLGSRLSAPLVRRFGRARVMRVAGTGRACWSIGLAFVGRGAGGLALVLGVQVGLVTCMGIYNPLVATARLEAMPNDRVARALAAWSVTSAATIAALTALWGVLAGAVGVRSAIGLAGVLLLATPLLLPPQWRPETFPASVPVATERPVRSAV
jgi:MFS family permease